MSFRNKRIAVVGVSANAEKFGHRIFRDLFRSGYSVFGVHLSGGCVCGQAVFHRLGEIDPVPELVVIVVPPSSTERIVEECRDLGIPAVWMQPGSESDLAVRKAREYGLSVIFGRCIMSDEGLW